MRLKQYHCKRSDKPVTAFGISKEFHQNQPTIPALRRATIEATSVFRCSHVC